MENQNTEWKESWRDEYMKTLCAFANTRGGVIEVGRKDSGEITGAPNAGRLLEELPNKIRSTIGVIADVSLRDEDGRMLVVIGVNAYPNPINYKGRYYYRSGSTTQEITGTALDEFILRAYGRTWDSVPVPGVTADDLDIAAFRAFRKLALSRERLNQDDLDVSDVKLLESLRLVEGKYLTRAAVLLFHDDPEKWIRGAYVKIAYFTNDAEIRYQDEIHGSLVTMPDRVLDTLYLKYFKGLISYEGIQRVENYPVAKSAIREAVMNAISHKDYGTGNPIQIRVYDDKVIVTNDGHLPAHWTLEDFLGSHPSQPHNPLIADTFFRCGHIEAWGRGIERIGIACRAAGKPEPVFNVNPSNIMLTLNVDEIYLARLNSDVPINVPINVPLNVPLNPAQGKILAMLRRDGTQTVADLASLIGVTDKTVKRHIKVLREFGLLEREGSNKKGRWIVRLGNGKD